MSALALADEPDIMSAYHKETEQPSVIIRSLRNLYRIGYRDGFTADLVRDAKKIFDNKALLDAAQEVADAKRHEIDLPSFLYGKALAADEYPVLPITISGFFRDINGKFHKNVFPHIFDGDPYELYKDIGLKSIDSFVTDMITRQVLQANQESLLKKYVSFVINESHFYYIPDFSSQNILLSEYFLKDGKIDVFRLTPYLCCPGNITDKKAKVLHKSEYDTYFFDFISHRLKITPALKILTGINRSGPLCENDIVFDWSGFREVKRDMQQLGEFQNFMEQATIFEYKGNIFRKVYIHPKNHFDEQKPKTGFEGLINNLIFQYKGRTYPVEVQVQNKDNYYLYELQFNPSDPANRVSFSESKDVMISTGEWHDKLNQVAKSILLKIYRTPTTEIDIKTLEYIRKP